MTAVTAARWNGVDHAAVQALRANVAASMRAELDAKPDGDEIGEDERHELGRRHIRDAVARLSGIDRDAFANAVLAEMFLAGRLQPLLDDPLVANVDIYGAKRVRVTLTDGSRVDGPPIVDSDRELENLVRRLATHPDALSSRPFDDVHPCVRLRLPGGSRLSAITAISPHPSVSVRCYRFQPVSLRDIHAWGGFTAQVGAFLEAAVLARCNLMISGQTFAGKTALLRALGDAIPSDERVFTIEDFRELGFADLRPHGDVVELEARPANAEGTGEVTMGMLVEYARDQNPDRLIVGQVMGGREVLAMLDAMTEGEDGCLSTIHARSAKGVFSRIASYALTAGLPVDACHSQTAEALDFVVHLGMRPGPDGRPRRYVQSICEVAGYNGTQVVSSEVFTSTPALTQRPAARISDHHDHHTRLADAGYDQTAWAQQ